jgi:hypothetical protein
MAKKKVKKKISKKAVKRKKQTCKRKRKFPAKQGKSKIGYKKPPKEHQFKPGQSGNPAGPPVRRTQLWVWFCKYMNMTKTQIDKFKKKELTYAQQAALELAEAMRTGKYCHSHQLARHVFDREEGRAVEHVIFENENTLSDDECEEIREVLRRNLG